MATRFVRIDLSEEARDYRPIAVEPGVPMLDRSGANARILFRWLGGMVAEPMWEDDLVGFYVRDDQGGRLEEVYCQPASSQDLQGNLRDELAKLHQRLDQSRGETKTERTLRKVLLRSFQDVVDNPGRTDHDSYFFKYKDVLGNWRLVWCWGYERLDQEPATAVVCTDPECNLLFVRRPGKSPRCPACSGTIVPRKKKHTRRHVSLLLLLLLLLLGLGLWMIRPRLIATPNHLEGTVGSKLDCAVVEKGWFRSKDVTRDAIGVTFDPQVAKFDRSNGSIRLTGQGETGIEFRYHGRTAEVSVNAAASPNPNELVSLELSPAGPIELPLGQMMRLQAFATFGDGRRQQVPSERLKWFSQEKAVPGLELYRDSEVVGAVGATKAGAGPLSVYAKFQGKESNQVAFKSVEADPNVRLAIDVDRTLRIAGEGGRAVLTANSPRGDVELVPSLASFQSGNNKVLKFTNKVGKFAAISPGRSTVTGSHIAAKDPATREFQVCDPAKARLAFDPPSVTVPVNQRADLRLMLEAELDDGGKKETLRAEMLGPDVAYNIAQPEAVRFNPPMLTGLKPAAQFLVSGSIPVLPPASAKVQVVDAAAKKLRITPSAASPLATGQQVALIVEQQAGDSEGWKEVRPDAVEWKNVPKTVVWTPPTENLRPTVTLPPDFQGEAKLDAAVGNAAASVAFKLKDAAPLAADARLVVDREANGKYLAVGQSQRYSVLMDKNGQSEPATDVHWPADFENDYVKWEAPVLTAKREGYTQFLRAEVAGRNVLWHTTTYRPGEYAVEEKQPSKPDWVKIFSQQGSQDVQSVRFPVGATFTDFKVEVHYPDGYTRFVTKKAMLATPESAASALLTADHGKLTGLRPGKTKVNAEFQGVVSKDPLDVEVLADVDIDKIVIEPGSAVLRPGETYDLHAIGYKNGQSIGDITGLGSLTWKSSNTDVARIGGNSVIASSVGQTQVTVERKGFTSFPAQVTVSNAIADELRVVPGAIEMSLGQNLQLGSDVQVLRGSLDVSQQAAVVPESPGVVAFDPATRSLTAKNLGEVTLGVTVGDKLARARVRVGALAIVAGGKLVVEPGSLLLAPGQADRLTVYIETPNGDKIDRTGSAGYTADDPAVAGIDEGIARVKALKTGKTNIAVKVAGFAPVAVPLEVTNEEIKELTADPATEEMAVSEVKALRVFGRADKSGLKELFPQSDLKAAPRKPDVAEVVGDVVRGKTVGEDTIDVAWRDKLKLEVPAKVTENTITGLQIDPKEFTINTSEGKTYEVSAMRGGNRVILTERDGVQLNVTDPNVAAWASGTTVISKAPGQTKVIATLGGEKAEAILNVTEAPPGGLPAGRTDVIADGGYIYDDHGGRVYIGDRRITEIKPAGKVVALRFEPDRYLAGVQAMPQTAKLLRQYENGGFDDVSNDPGVKITQNPDSSIAKMEKSEGGWKVSPVAAGVTTATAALDGQTASMNIEINGAGGANAPLAGALIVNPSTISLWSGETAVIANAEVDPGNGQPHVPVKVKVTAPDNQGIVTADGDKITGRSVGDTTVTVTAENGPSTTINVHVAAADAITINPPEISLQVGQKVTPAVMTQSGSGTDAVAVPAQIESLDTKVLNGDPSSPGQFVALTQGQTQLHAVYRGKEAFAKVSVAGQRFESVRSSYNRSDKTMTIEVLSAAGEGELEYRVFEDGAAAREDWVSNQSEGDARKAVLRTEPLDTSKDEFHLVIEARDKATKSLQKYPLTLVRSVTFEQQNTSPPAPQPK
jgi:hypothetical protein